MVSVNSNDVTIDKIFGNEKYYIDFYQRDYKWSKGHVGSLLEDIFFKFDNEYRNDIDVKPDTINKLSWYYLNTFVTNSYEGKKFIVDGQQRFTTITIILISLFHLANKYNLNERVEWLKSKIYGTGPEGKDYWMGTDERKDVLDKLLNNYNNELNKTITINNILNNYDYVTEELKMKLSSEHKCDAFILYFLRRLILVEISIEESKDVPMVFEVINDRGERLKPYEVFKGELLGQLAKEEIEEYYNIWTNRINELQAINEYEADNFFRLYFRAKFVNTRPNYNEFEQDYHKTIFSNKWNDTLKLKRNPIYVKNFIKNEFDYFVSIYVKLLQTSKEEGNFLFYNSLNEQDRQYLLIISTLNHKDPNEQEKIHLVAKLFDKHFSMLQLFGCYDSNRFTETIIELNNKLRGQNIDEIEKIFSNQLLNDINVYKNTNYENIFSDSLFTQASINNLNKRFIRYFYARIEHFISDQIKTVADSYHNLVRNTGSVNGYHVEHILANNEENFNLFDNDENQFLIQRNRLGSILLLKGSDNISSSSETYKNKLKTYSHGTIWARTLTQDFYHRNPDFNKFIQDYKLDFKPLDNFDQESVEYRQKLLFQIIKHIWK